MKKFKTMVKGFIFILIGILLFLLLTPIFIPKTINAQRGFYRAIIQSFYTEPKNSLDVVFIGDSSIYKGISPMKIWQEYGIASYDFASPTQKIWDSYYCIKEVIKYQKPKVIVFNVDQAFSTKPMTKFYKRHLYDNMPSSINKWDAVTDKSQKNSKSEIMSLMLPFLRFHSRWSELNEDDFQYAYTNYHYPLKGYCMVKDKKGFRGNKNYIKKKNPQDKLPKKAYSYLNEIKKVCEENGITLLLVEVPAPRIWNQTKHNEIKNWTEKNKISFLDMNLHLDEIMIDWEKDTHDEGVHLNIYGAEKVSNYIGKYLKEHYQLKNRRTDENYKQWEIDLKKYEEIKR